jgi:hypothetical protein
MKNDAIEKAEAALRKLEGGALRGLALRYAECQSEWCRITDADENPGRRARDEDIRKRLTGIGSARLAKLLAPVAVLCAAACGCAGRAPRAKRGAKAAGR